MLFVAIPVGVVGVLARFGAGGVKAAAVGHKARKRVVPAIVSTADASAGFERAVRAVAHIAPGRHWAVFTCFTGDDVHDPADGARTIHAPVRPAQNSNTLSQCRLN